MLMKKILVLARELPKRAKKRRNWARDTHTRPAASPCITIASWRRLMASCYAPATIGRHYGRNHYCSRYRISALWALEHFFRVFVAFHSFIFSSLFLWCSKMSQYYNFIEIVIIIYRRGGDELNENLILEVNDYPIKNKIYKNASLAM